MIQVVLGTPISRCGGHVTLGSLEGQAVIVTKTTRRHAHVAKAIEVARPRAESAEYGYWEVC